MEKGDYHIFSIESCSDSTRLIEYIAAEDEMKAKRLLKIFNRSYDWKTFNEVPEREEIPHLEWLRIGHLCPDGTFYLGTKPLPQQKTMA